ncbi:MAG: helix-turn-helix transcriptional regulator [Clostridia bacterium]|nr:helix-turn-helix transcriptional regulator [Clostridia bacterium]
MDQGKIGKFISERRKLQNMTQMQLAEKLGITDRAVSKWETGKSLPDASIMLELCKLLKITVNDLLCGEVVSMENYDEKTQNALLEMVKKKEEADKRLLLAEVVLGVLSTTFFLTLVVIAAFLIKLGAPIWVGVAMMVFGLLQFIVAIMFAVRIEQVAGYYECAECGHRYVPSYASVNLAMHMGRTRFMKCPRCGKKSWQKKVISKE